MKNTVFETERAWIEVNMENLRHNVNTLKKAVPPGCELMAVVKAEAYGHNAALTAAYLNEMGVTAFAAATIDEGIRLRECGVGGEILILGFTNISRASELREYDLMQTLISFEYAAALNDQGILVKTHIKIDTGMHRLGISWEDFSAVKKIFSMENLKVCGMFTHLCCADRKPEFSDGAMLPDESFQGDSCCENICDAAFTRGQIRNFYTLTDALQESGICLPKLHIQSSYGLLNYPGLVCDYVRVGVALYGVLSSPEDDTILRPDLRPVLTLKSRVVLTRRIRKGDSVGYGRAFTAERDSRIAILPVGYGDGFPRSLSDGRGSVLIRRHIVPVAGRICMDQLAVDITDAEDIAVGDIAILIGAENCDELSAPDVAARAGSISNELLCRLGARLPVIVT